MSPQRQMTNLEAAREGIALVERSMDITEAASSDLDAVMKSMEWAETIEDTHMAASQLVALAKTAQILAELLLSRPRRTS